ncbi:hypothetical protein GW916_01280, partial [bacterium]|nr:hypothetical protein [bacterium]
MRELGGDSSAIPGSSLTHDPGNEFRYFGSDVTVKADKSYGRSYQGTFQRTVATSDGRIFGEIKPEGQDTSFRVPMEQVTIDYLRDSGESQGPTTTVQDLKEIKIDGESAVHIEDPPKEETQKQENKRLDKLDAVHEDINAIPDAKEFEKNLEIYPIAAEKALKSAMAFIKKFVSVVPEFKRAPVFTVVNVEYRGRGRAGTYAGGNLLRFTDSYQFDFPPKIFGLNAENLQVGQKVRLDLDKWLGVKSKDAVSYTNVGSLKGNVQQNGDFWTDGHMVVRGTAPRDNAHDSERLADGALENIVLMVKKSIRDNGATEVDEPGGYESFFDEEKTQIVTVGGVHLDKKILDFIVKNTDPNKKTTFSIVSPGSPVAINKGGETVALIMPIMKVSNPSKETGVFLPKSTAKNPAITKQLFDGGKASATEKGQESVAGVSDKKSITGKLDDFGEKIGGARKDTSSTSGKSTAKTPKEEQSTPWEKRFIAMENTVNPGEWSIADTKSKSRFGGMLPQKFSSEVEAKEAIPLIAVAQSHRVMEDREERGRFSIYKEVGKRKLFKVVNKTFPSREEGVSYMATHAKDILSLKTNFGEEILPSPEIAERTGAARRTTDATPEMFMETFSPRGIEFGNWNNQDERQQVLNHAYDGLMDLAEVLNVPPKALMLNGDLSIAFGARGQGLSGAKAHYERNYGVINLTKISGAGSLAHEWFHALDHYLARSDGKAPSERKKNPAGNMVYDAKTAQYTYQSHGESYNSKLRDELVKKYRNIIDTMFKKAEQYVTETDVADKFLRV